MPRLLAMLAIALQLVLPGSLAVAEAKGVDVARFICAPSGQLSPAAKEAAQRIADVINGEAPDEQTFGDHCPYCTLVHGAPLPAPVAVSAPSLFVFEQAFAVYEPRLIHEAQGPPLGSRGPPIHI